MLPEVEKTRYFGKTELKTLMRLEVKLLYSRRPKNRPRSRQFRTRQADGTRNSEPPLKILKTVA